MFEVGEHLSGIGLKHLEAISGELKVVFIIDGLDKQLVAAFGFHEPFSSWYAN